MPPPVRDAISFFIPRARLEETLLATPLRMAAHLEGKRHARAVARRYLAACRESGEEPTTEGGAERRAALFGEHSTAVLGGGVAEPPDVALARLHGAVGC